MWTPPPPSLGSNWSTQNLLPRFMRPCSSSRMPGASLSATQGWLNQTATSGPLSSLTRASVRGRMRRLRDGTVRALFTTASTVASSSGPTLAIGRTSCRSV